MSNSLSATRPVASNAQLRDWTPTTVAPTIACATQCSPSLQDRELHHVAVDRQVRPLPWVRRVTGAYTVTRKDAPAHVIPQRTGLSPEMIHLLARQHEGIHLCPENRVVDSVHGGDPGLDQNLRPRSVSRVFTERQRQARGSIPGSAVAAKGAQPRPAIIECVGPKRRTSKDCCGLRIERAHPFLGFRERRGRGVRVPNCSHLHEGRTMATLGATDVRIVHVLELRAATHMTQRRKRIRGASIRMVHARMMPDSASSRERPSGTPRLSGDPPTRSPVPRRCTWQPLRHRSALTLRSRRVPCRDCSWP
jgi:hypothetical protein